MSARAAYPMIYARVIAGRTEEQVTEIDAILGDEVAKARIEEREADILASSGAVEFG